MVSLVVVSEWLAFEREIYKITTRVCILCANCLIETARQLFLQWDRTKRCVQLNLWRSLNYGVSKQTCFQWVSLILEGKIAKMSSRWHHQVIALILADFNFSVEIFYLWPSSHQNLTVFVLALCISYLVNYWNNE